MVSWLDRVNDQAEALAHARELMVGGRHAEAYVALDRVASTTTDPYARADALVQRVSAVLNLGRTAEYTASVEEAFAAVRELPEPYLYGHLHALAALAAQHQGALERCVTHLVQSSQALGASELADVDTAWGWHDLAMAYSYLGFHGYALAAIERAREVGTSVGITDEKFAAPGIRLRGALALDHNGDTDGCMRVLRDIASDLDRILRGGRLDQLRPISRMEYGYAAARRSALGESSDVDIAMLLSHGGDGVRARQLRQLGEVCVAIAGGRPIEALARLDTVQVSAETLGASESARLRSLTYQRSGDHAAAHRADRHAFRLATQSHDRLRDVYIEGIAARLSHENLRRTVAKYAGEALTDPLTGLPNRRHLERYVAALVGRGQKAVVGVADLDGFKLVNTTHGHHSGDLVLQRIAGIIARVMRRGDFVARYGGDEFVVVLPNADVAEAAEVARRIKSSVAAEDWQSLVPGTPVGVSVGWGELSGTRTTLGEALLGAFETADREMLRAKVRPAS